MDHLIHESELEQLKLRARGNPSKMAVYAEAKNEYQTQLSTHFNEEFPFVHSFSDSHLDELRQFAEDNPEDESAQVRYAIQKDRFEAREADKTAHIDRRLLREDLTRKVAAGDVTKSDLEKAAELAKMNGSVENKVLYATIKNLLNGGNE
ncbi:hypothetical protein [Fictibacillus gelatini]|uniref:hypothetical protein n=1 Tax=Fictibacillus gelatini TaxID=225985 RepID=UPI0004246D2C|nr:hypothetical protein [Fictibacillus gelatini]